MEGSPCWRSRDDGGPTQTDRAQDLRGRSGREGYSEGTKGPEKERNPPPRGQFSGQKQHQKAFVQMQIPRPHPLLSLLSTGLSVDPRNLIFRSIRRRFCHMVLVSILRNTLLKPIQGHSQSLRHSAPATQRKGVRTHSAYFFCSFSRHPLTPHSCSPGHPQALLCRHELSGKYTLGFPRSREGLELLVTRMPLLFILTSEEQKPLSFMKRL